MRYAFFVMINSNNLTAPLNGGNSNETNYDQDVHEILIRQNVQNHIDNYLMEKKKISLEPDEILLLADLYIGPYLNYNIAQSYIIASDVVDPDFVSMIEVDRVKFASKLYVMPHNIVLSLLADIQEAWNHHNNDFFEFLQTRCYKFFPIEPSHQHIVSVVGGTLGDGSIVVDRYPSHVSPEDIKTVLHSFHEINPRGRKFIEEEIVFSEIIGKTKCVQTGPQDTICFARRHGRSGLTRFVKDRSPEDCNTVFVVLKKEREFRYALITAFIGKKPEPEMFDENAFSKSADPSAARTRAKQFWSQHAMIYDPSVIVPGTETTKPE
jgi:hypothetical protein